MIAFVSIVVFSFIIDLHIHNYFYILIYTFLGHLF